jgi:tRNA-Thr(GGU) m(6)t(6)A37 methyltransferase TsaA
MIELQPIGKIISPYLEKAGTPIQMTGSETAGKIEIFKEYQEGLRDLEGFSTLIVLYQFHRIKETSLEVVPFLDDVTHGIFATRSPARPNRIGFSILELIYIEDNMLHVKNLDVLDGAPVLDIKPYVSAFDSIENTRNGWLDKRLKDSDFKKDDGRFN